MRPPDINDCNETHFSPYPHGVFASLPESVEGEHTPIQLDYSEGNKGLLSHYHTLM